MSRELAERIAAQLAAAGVDTMFGLPGGGPNLDKIGAATRAGLRFVLAHTETAACIMASTYGLLSGVPGVCVVTRGPGVASAVNGAAQATLDRSPLLLLSDRVPAAQAARVPHQRIAQNDLMGAVSKASGTLGSDDAEEVLAGALALAMAAPAGTVHLDYDPAAAGWGVPAPPAPPTSADPAALVEATLLLGAARRPIVLVGNDAIAATSAVREFVRDGSVPALMTYQAKGVIPDSWPTAGGLFTNGAMERPLLDQADLILAIGLDPVEPIPAEWRGDLPVVSVTPWRPEDRYFDPTVELVGPIGPTLEALGTAVGGAWEEDAGRRAKQEAHEALRIEGGGFTPREVVEVASARYPDARVTVDAGAHFLVAMPLWPVEEPHRLLISNGLATMGYALPAAIGSALANPTRPVVCLVGDGGLGMTLSELETVARLDLDITTVVFNDAALSLIEIKQTDAHGGEVAVRYGMTDFAKVARGLGMPASVVTSREELDGVLREPAAGPRLVDARIDASSYPHLLKVTRG